MPLGGNSVYALVFLAWIKEIGGLSNRYLLGLDYEKINPRQNYMLIRFAWARKLFLPLVILSIVILSLFLGFGAYSNIQLTHKNKMLVEELVGVLQDYKLVKQHLEQIAQERTALQGKIESLALQIKSATEIKSEQVPAVIDNTKDLNGVILKLAQERDLLQAKLAALQLNEKAIQAESLRLETKKGASREGEFG